MTENDLSVARDVGELKADMRTVKHDVNQLSGKMDGLSLQLTNMTVKQERGLGFIAGAAFIITSAGGLLIAFFKLAFGGHA